MEALGEVHLSINWADCSSFQGSGKVQVNSGDLFHSWDSFLHEVIGTVVVCISLVSASISLSIFCHFELDLFLNFPEA